MTPVTDPNILAQLNGAGPKPVTDPAVLAQLNGPQGFVANAEDFAKSIPRGALSSFLGALSNIGAAGAVDAQFSGVPTASPETMPTGPQGVAQVEATVGKLPTPQGPFGRVGEAIGEGLGNPASYIGPGGLPLKVAGAILGSAGSEGAGQAAKGTQYEGAARLAGSILGGAAAAKTLGPTVQKAAIPTLEELKAAADRGYTAARNSGLELNPQGLSSFATDAQQELTNGPKYAFTGGANGTAPKTFAILDALQAPPAGARVTAANLDTLRKNIGNIAGETKDFKPTADAKAAMVLKRRLAGFMEDIPQDSVMAGNPEDYVRAIKQANGDFAAASRLGTFDARITNAENATDRQVAGSLDSQIKSKVGGALDKPKSLRGLSQDEIDQIKLINKGTVTSNLLRQLGRGGAGVIPLMTQAAVAAPLAAATGGASIIPQALVAAGLYGARKGAERMTVSRAKALADMLAKRSPEYQSRLAAVPYTSTLPNKAAIVRALLQGAQ
jgi:hypothetical protein